jgi:hypothetical protein
MTTEMNGVLARRKQAKSNLRLIQLLVATKPGSKASSDPLWMRLRRRAGYRLSVCFPLTAFLKISNKFWLL